MINNKDLVPGKKYRVKDEDVCLYIGKNTDGAYIFENVRVRTLHCFTNPYITSEVFEPRIWTKKAYIILSPLGDAYSGPYPNYDLALPCGFTIQTVSCVMTEIKE